MGAVGSVRFFNGIEELTRRKYKLRDGRYQVVDEYDNGETYTVPYMGSRVVNQEQAEYLMNLVKS